MMLSEIKIDYHIYCDLDGVLVDFRKKAMEVTGIYTPPEVMTSKEKKYFWRSILNYERNGGEFWGEMDFMPDGRDLWDYIKKYNPTILTASGSAGDAPREKREWVQKHLGSSVKCIVVGASKDKATYAASNHILIDDSVKAIAPWTAVGGIPIFHKSAFESIKQLQELSL